MGDIAIIYLVGLVVFFLIGVFITRWIFSIGKIVESLELQNQYSVAQMRLLTKMLLHQGVPASEISDVLENGNKLK
jgi:hypothetical protein